MTGRREREPAAESTQAGPASPAALEPAAPRELAAVEAPAGWAGRAEVLVSGIALAALVSLPLLDMAGRRVLGRGVPGAAGYTQHLTLWLTFLGGALAARYDRHLALSTVTFMHGRLRRVAELVGSAAAVLVSSMLAAAATTLVEAQRTSTEVLAGGVPIWVVQLALPVGFAALAARFWWRAPGGWRGRAVVLVTVAACIGIWASGLRGAALLWPGAIALAAALLLGAPLFVGMGGFALLFFHASDVPIAAVAAETYRLAASPTLPTIPLFALAGTLLGAGGASRRLVGLFRAVAGWMPGGTAVAAVGACAFVTALTGASGVTILALGGFLLPILVQERYPEDSSVGLLTASGSIGLLFPPSLPVILYAIYAEVSFEDVFVAGFVPGVLLVLAVSAWAMRLGFRSGVARTPFSARAALRAVAVAKWDLFLPVFIVLSITTGIATLVEAAALTAAYVVFVEVVVHRTLSFRRDGGRVVAETAALFGSLLFVLGVALGLTSYLVDAEIPMRAAQWVRHAISSRWVFLLLLNVFLLAVGMLMDIFSAIVVVVPLVLPMGRAFGVDPLHLGIVFLANLELGYLTPPVGLNLFLGSLRFRRPLLDVARTVIPVVLVMAGWVLLITYVPGLTLGLGQILGR
jgi:tripartite ATP-independent transporter DctM subunit